MSAYACPICRPAAFDGALARVPSMQFCPAHRGHVLRFILARAGVELHRDAANVATVRPASFSAAATSSSPHPLRPSDCSSPAAVAA